MTVDPGHGEQNQHLPIERTLAVLLRIGSIIAAGFLIVGIALMFMGKGEMSRFLITAGLLALMATPIMRVLVAGLIFVREKDWRFAFFCLVVLCALTVGIILGREG